MEDYVNLKRKREEVQSRSIVLDRNGGISDPHEIILENTEENIYNFIQREEGLYKGNSKEIPPHIRIMAQQELVDYEPAADLGHFRFYPKGALMKSLLEGLAEEFALNRLNATRIETPLIYRNKGAVKEQAESFHENDYRIPNKDDGLILRFAGDFGLFSMLKDANVNEDQTPLRIYETSPSFRLEKAGSCTGLKRLRAFTIPDVHCFCKDFNQAIEEFEMLHKTYAEFLNNLNLPYALGFRTTEDFFSKNKDYISRLGKEINKDSFVEILNEMKHYWVLKNEFQYMDSQKDNVQLSTVQLDIADSERYGLKYTNNKGNISPFTIVHSSIGSIERILGAVIEERGKELKNGEQAAFPYWLSPTQIRLIPFDEEYIPDCLELRDKLRDISRIDVDDRLHKDFRRKIKSSQQEWVPSYVLIGKQERENKTYKLMTRGKEMLNHSGTYSIEELRKLSSSLIDKKPFRDFTYSPLVSKQIRFKGNY